MRKALKWYANADIDELIEDNGNMAQAELGGECE